ncbi:MAG: diadenylate cyclase, partial [Planctomycetota bacterium]
MPIDPRTLLQIVILSVGAHIVLSFLRTTRGTGMVRGVLIVLIVVFGLLLGLARSLALAELSYIVDALTGFVVVILAIVFQPELRRGIVSLGDNPLLRTVIGAGGKDVVDEVAAACVTMAKRNQGALIAFERRVALDAWTQKAVRVDSRVNRHLLDNLFFPGSPLHDGAVIIREGRVAAAQAILPLSEKENLARSIGTRHRAALGLSEETDAVVVAVSEETGLITVCQGGQMERRVLKDELADDLRARLGREGASRRTSKGAGTASPRTTLRPLLRGLGQKLVALVRGIGSFLLAHRPVQDTRTFTLRVAAEPQSLERSAPTGGTLSILLPSDDLHVAAPTLGARVS